MYGLGATTDCGCGLTVPAGATCPTLRADCGANLDKSACVCGPPGYCYGAEFCSAPRLDSHGRDFRTDSSAGSPGISNTTAIGIAAAAAVGLMLLFGGGR